MKILFSFFCMLISFYSFSQDAVVHYFDSDGKAVKEKKSAYLIRQQQNKAKTWQVDHYQSHGPLMKSETFSDEKLTIRNGRHTWYDAAGRIDSTGFYSNNQRDKSWYYYKKTDSVQVSKQVDYENGKVIKEFDYSVNKPEAIDTTGKNPKESEFTGGSQGWITYLTKVFRYPKEAVDYEIQGSVWVMFIINKVGKVEDPFLYKSVEMSVDDEALRVIKATPTWIPATLNGEKLDSYKLQPITFRIL